LDVKQLVRLEFALTNENSSQLMYYSCTTAFGSDC
jgi:hypothetical protein